MGGGGWGRILRSRIRGGGGVVGAGVGGGGGGGVGGGGGGGGGFLGGGGGGGGGDDVIEAFGRIAPRVVRWPGGCFADDYHWRDGVGPRRERPVTVNTWWG